MKMLEIIKEQLLRKISKLYLYIRLRFKTRGKLKIEGDARNIFIGPGFRCEGDLWLASFDGGLIIIDRNVKASGPLIITSTNKIVVSSEVLFGPNVLITDHLHGNPREIEKSGSPHNRPLYSRGPVTIKSNVLFGANTVVLSPSCIGFGAIIGANRVISKDVRDYEIES